MIINSLQEHHTHTV